MRRRTATLLSLALAAATLPGTLTQTAAAEEPPVTQPDAVSVPGSHNSEMRCADDWAPGCDEAQLTLDSQDSIWKRTYDSIPAGDHEYKAAINRS